MPLDMTLNALDCDFLTHDNIIATMSFLKWNNLINVRAILALQYDQM